MLTLFDDSMEAIAELTLPNKQAYARRHGYELIVERQTRDPLRPTAWSKIPALHDHLPRFDWLFWHDIDALFLDMDRRLESLVDATKDAIFPTDIGNEGGFPGMAAGRPRINSSHFFMRNCAWSQRFLTEVYDQTQFLDHRWWEQRAVMHVLETNHAHREHVRMLSPGELKTAAEAYQPGDFAVHFGGRNKLARIEAFLSQHCSVTTSPGAEQRGAARRLVDRPFILRSAAQDARPGDRC